MFIPVRDNEGVPFDPAHDVVFEVQLAKLFKGFTRLPSEAGGGWTDKDDRYYPDAMRVYIVAVDGVIVDGPALRFTAQFVKEHYRQEAVYLRYLGVSEVL